MSRVVVVTGANTGIGFEIVKQLASKLPQDKIILCSRNQERGESALKELVDQGSKNVDLGILDIADAESIEKFAVFIQENYQKIDILVNNAGFAFKGNATESVYEQARKTIDINYYGTLHLTNRLKEYMVPQGRIINVSSTMGKTEYIQSDELVHKFTNPSLTVAELSELMEQYIEETKKGTHIESGWPKTTYSTSKNGVSALTRIWAREWTDFQINACCPGWCRTNMAGDKAPKSAAEGAETPVWLATRDDIVTGKFWKEEKEDQW